MSQNQDKFIITPEMLANAKTYMPLSSKEALAKQIAESCVEYSEVASQNEIGKALISIPHLKVENIKLKNLCLLNTFLMYYLELTDISDESGAFTVERYDYYASSHPLNQLERYKNDRNLKDTAYELLADYREFEKIVNSEIYNLKMRNNDAIDRLMTQIEMFSNPEELKKILETFNSEVPKMKEILAKRKEEGQKKRASLDKVVNEKANKE